MTGGAAASNASPASPPLSRRTLVPPQRPRRELGWAAVFVLALTLAAFGWVLFGPGDRVLSQEDGDLALQFVHWRAFGFGAMRAGHLPLWNPHIFCGTPFFGGFQSALLYPPNWLCLFLPLGRAINLGIALHVFLAGFLMYLWARERLLRPLACAFAAVLFMFCGPHFAHISDGHLPNLCAMVWGPLIFLAIDRWLARRTAGAVLLGGGATALQILAGHPQYVFYTGIAAGLYGALGLVSAPRRWQAAAGLALVPVIAFGLSAVQVLEGLHAAGESLRSRGVSFVFASLFSFPPENFLTLVAPGFFGGVAGASTYWGRCSFSETSLFFGLCGLVCAIYGVATARRSDRFRLLGLALFLLLLALGSHTPLLGWLYRCIPGFNKFRGLAKFIYPASLFLILLAAIGFDSLLAAAYPPWTLLLGTATAALVLATAGFSLLPAGATASGVGPVGAWMRSLHATGEVFLPCYLVASPTFEARAARQAADSLFFGAAGTLLLLSLVLLAASRWRNALAGVLVLACAEMLVFAHGALPTFSLAGAQESPASDYLADHPAPAGSRILNLENPDIAMSIGAFDLWGYDPGVVRRYAEWMASSQGLNPDHLDPELQISDCPTLYASLLRCRYLFSPESLMEANHGELPVFTYSAANLAPRLAVISDVRVLAGRDAIFAALRDPAFDPHHTVILEGPPAPAPAVGTGPAGTAKLLAETTDSLTIVAELARPAVLVISDTFCSGWTVRSLLPASAKQSGQPPPADYRILPADYCLRAIPLGAGHHLLQVSYRPLAFVVGAWISSGSLALYLLAAANLWRRRSFPAVRD